MSYTVPSPEPDDIRPSSFLQINSYGMVMPYGMECELIRPTGRSDYQLMYMLSGKMEVWYDDVRHILSEGFVLYPPHAPQRYKDLQNCRRFYIHFNGFHVEEILKEAKLSCGVHPLALSPVIVKMLSRLIVELSQQDAVSAEKGLFLYILYILGKQQNNLRTPNDDVQDVITYITTHFNDEIHIDELAASCQLSPSHFMHLFKDATGSSPLAYQKRLRIDYAKSRLVGTDLPINQIAEQAGYSDPLYFSRIFKKDTGLSPKDFRETRPKPDGLDEKM